MARNRHADRSIKHQVRLRGQYSRISKQAALHLTTLRKQIEDELLGTKNLTAAASLRKTLRTIDGLVVEQYALLSDSVKNELADLFAYEAEWAAKAFGIKSALNLSRERVLALVANDPFDGKILKEWVAEQTLSTQNKLKQTVRMGVLNGLGPREIASGLVAGKLFDGSVKNTEILVRTAGNHFTAQADLKAFGSGGFNAYQLSAVLDTRTTTICASLDGKVYRLSDADRKVPPFHPGCRTIMIPIFDNEEPIKENYESWLTKQPKRDQIEALGAKRYEMWRQGERLDSFVDSDLHVIPLADLRRKD